MVENIIWQVGNYRLLHPIGQGAFGAVYLGEHVYLQTQAAIKLLQVQMGEDALQDFLAEARTIARLRHPNIVGLLEFGVESSTRTPFLVMEYAPNGTLRQRHPRGSRLPLELAVSYIQQVSAALSYAHDEKLIHRDIKPENLLLGAENEVLLADFGIALMAQSTYKDQPEVAGTAPYMAPEQLLGKPRFASDQYALAVVVYEWLSGRPPFRGSYLEIASQHLHAPPPALHLSVPGISPLVEQVVMTALSKEPEHRFASVQAFARALAQAIDPGASVVGPATDIHPPISNVMPPTPALPSQVPADSSPKPRRLFSFFGVALLVLLALLLIGGGGWLYAMRTFMAATKHAQTTAILSPMTQTYLTVTSGQPTLHDALDTNTTSNWIEYSPSEGQGCAFRDGAYYVISQDSFTPCLATGTHFNDFAYQVQMTLTPDSEGGLLFRSDAPCDCSSLPRSSHYYIFGINSSGSYHLAYQFEGGPVELAVDSSPAIKIGAGQTNVLTVIARGDTLSLYINASYLTSIHDSHRISGLLGVYAQKLGKAKDATEVAFREARVWEIS